MKTAQKCLDYLERKQGLRLRQEIRRKELVRRLYRQAREETIGDIGKQDFSIFCRIVDDQRDDRNFVRVHRKDGIIKSMMIRINLDTIKSRAREGYDNDYYHFRREKLNPLILHNRHNAIRFIIYHELRHIRDKIERPNEQIRNYGEFIADSWAIKHLARK